MYISPDATPAIKRRHSVEVDIVTKTVDALLKAKFLLSVDDGDGEIFPPTKDRQKILDALINTDEDYLFVYNETMGVVLYLGWVRFVYGNDDGYDVISDYTINLEYVLKHVL